MELAVIAQPSPIPDPSRHPLVGRIEVRSKDKRECGCVDIYHGKELLVGRDSSSCQFLLFDPTVSNRHLKIYSVVHDLLSDSEIAPLVYAEDLSSNGSYWENSLIGRGNGAVLLSDGDKIRISPRICVFFRSIKKQVEEAIDSVCADETSCFEASYLITKRKLGFGSGGQVYLAINVPIGRQVACKIVDRKSEPQEAMKAPAFKRLPWEKMSDVVEYPQSSDFRPGWSPSVRPPDRKEDDCFLSREIKILKSLSHPNIVRLERVFYTDNTHYIFQELVTGGDLYSFIEYKGGFLEEIQAGVIVRQVLEALKYLHENDIVHRDVKPDNILISSPAGAARVVLTDFGSATRLLRISQHEQKRLLSSVGTAEYTAPEIKGQNKFVKARGYTKAVDMWSLGCVIAALLAGASLFNKSHAYSSRANTERAIELAASECDLSELESAQWQHAGELAKSLVRGLLVLDECQRLTAAQALNHEWFTNDQDKAGFDAAYRKAIENWRATRKYSRMIEKIDPRKITGSTLLTRKERKGKRKSRTNMIPIDPHYTPPHKRVESIVSSAQSCTPSKASTDNCLAQQSESEPCKGLNKTPSKGPGKDLSKGPTPIRELSLTTKSKKKVKGRKQLSDIPLIGSLESGNSETPEVHTPSKITSDKEYIERLLQAMEGRTKPDSQTHFYNSSLSSQPIPTSNKRKRLPMTLEEPKSNTKGNETDEELASDLASSTLMEYDDCLSEELWHPSQDEETLSLLTPIKISKNKRQKVEVIILNRSSNLHKPEDNQAKHPYWRLSRPADEAASGIERLKISPLPKATVEVVSSDPIFGPVTVSRATLIPAPALKRPNPNTSKVRVSPPSQTNRQPAGPFRSAPKFRTIIDEIEDKENFTSKNVSTNGTQPNSKRRRTRSVSLVDAAELEVYDMTGRERRTFRSALSYGKAVNKNKAEKGLGKKGEVLPEVIEIDD